jgi:hypothetical protein
MAKIKLEKTWNDYIVLDASTKIKVINRFQAEKIVLLDFNNHIYLIDDTNNNQNVCVFSQNEDGENEDLIKKM